MRLFELQRDERAWRKAAFEVSVILRPADGTDSQDVKQVIEQAAMDFGWKVARWKVDPEGENLVNFIFYVSEDQIGLEDWQKQLVRQGARSEHWSSLIGKQLRRLSRGKVRFKVVYLNIARPVQPAFRKGSTGPTGWHHVE